MQQQINKDTIFNLKNFVCNKPPMSVNFEQLNRSLEDPKKWEDVEQTLLTLIKHPDEITRLEADLLMKKLQRNKFNIFLKKFDAPHDNKEITMQRTVSRTLSMIIPRGLQVQDNTESESENEDIKKKATQVSQVPQVPQVPPKPKPQKPLPPIPNKEPDHQIPTQTPNQLNQSNVYTQPQPTSYFPTLEELEAQFPKPKKTSKKHKESSPSTKQPPIQQASQPVNSLLNQTPSTQQITQQSLMQSSHQLTAQMPIAPVNAPLAEPIHLPPADSEYKMKMLQNYLFNQSQIAQEPYVMDTPTSGQKMFDSPQIDVMSSISNRVENISIEPPAQKPLPTLDEVAPQSQEMEHVEVQKDNGPHHGLNTVYLPKLIIAEFMKIAQLNTSKNTETCGLLSGKLRRIKKSSIKQQSAYLVTHLIIPHQTGTPNSCVMENEELVANYQIDNNLITLGWIHTHPTQTVFLAYVVFYEFIRFTHTFSFSIDIA